MIMPSDNAHMQRHFSTVFLSTWFLVAKLVFVRIGPPSGYTPTTVWTFFLSHAISLSTVSLANLSLVPANLKPILNALAALIFT